MQGWQLFASPPFWAIFIGTLLVALLAVEGGYSWARYRRQRSAKEREREKEAAVGAMVGPRSACSRFCSRSRSPRLRPLPRLPGGAIR